MFGVARGRRRDRSGRGGRNDAWPAKTAGVDGALDVRDSGAFGGDAAVVAGARLVGVGVGRPGDRARARQRSHPSGGPQRMVDAPHVVQAGSLVQPAVADRQRSPTSASPGAPPAACSWSSAPGATGAPSTERRAGRSAASRRGGAPGEPTAGRNPAGSLTSRRNDGALADVPVLRHPRGITVPR